MAASRRRVIWAREALDALDEAAAYVARDSMESAQRLVEDALELASSLATLSERGRVEIGRSEIRELFLHRYRLLYEVRADDVFVLAFLHAARDFDRWRRGG